MRYLLRPNPRETLIARGRYSIAGPEDGPAEEQAERYANEGTPYQSWRGEWRDERSVLLSHALVGPEGIERVRLRLLIPGRPGKRLTLTPEPGRLLVNRDEVLREIELPDPVAIWLPLPSLAAQALRIDPAADAGRASALLTVEWDEEGFKLERADARLEPVGFDDLEIGVDRLRARRWRVLRNGDRGATLSLDRNGNVLRMRYDGAEATLERWVTFG